MEAALTTIAAWLSVNFMLPPVYEPPRVAFASNEEGGYDDATRTIYLPKGWTGESPAELSQLVHEMARHMQNVAGPASTRPEDRDKLAAAAQRQWLAVFDGELLREFRLDPLALLVRTRCL